MWWKSRESLRTMRMKIIGNLYGRSLTPSIQNRMPSFQRKNRSSEASRSPTVYKTPVQMRVGGE
jgi:hypothetical protein